MVRKDEIIKRNLELHAEWMKYIFTNPDVFDKNPKEAVLVILPEDDQELYNENYKILQENQSNAIPVFVVKMKTPKPQVSNMEVIVA